MKLYGADRLKQIRERQTLGASPEDTAFLLSTLDVLKGERDGLDLKIRGYRQAAGDFCVRVAQLVDPQQGPLNISVDTWTALAELRRGTERFDVQITELRSTIARGQHYTTIRRVDELERENRLLIVERKRLLDRVRQLDPNAADQEKQS